MRAEPRGPRHAPLFALGGVGARCRKAGKSNHFESLVSGLERSDRKGSMPEFPDIVVYMEALERRVVGHVLESLEVRGPSLLRTADPPIYAIQDHKVTALRRRQAHCLRFR